ncbi:MAG: hypothetical protein JWM59_3605, partial [Verrucomicrobiales bacterium]|nr:hypothetical protein [Verrucomicrobiales bacterium]
RNRTQVQYHMDKTSTELPAGMVKRSKFGVSERRLAAVMGKMFKVRASTMRCWIRNDQVLERLQARLLGICAAQFKALRDLSE